MVGGNGVTPKTCPWDQPSADGPQAGRQGVRPVNQPELSITTSKAYRIGAAASSRATPRSGPTNRVSAREDPLPPGNGLPRPETGGPKWPWNRLAPPTETKPVNSPAKSPTKMQLRAQRTETPVRSGLRGGSWEDSNQEPYRYEWPARGWISWSRRNCAPTGRAFLGTCTPSRY
jgi:hypothetical protein